MTFDKYKRAVFRKAKAANRGHMCPNADVLYRLWSTGVPVDTVVDKHCTVEAQRRRHGLDTAEMTPEEADAAYDASPAIPMTAEEVDDIVERVTGKRPKR